MGPAARVLCCCLIGFASTAGAADLLVQVRDASGKPLAVPADGAIRLPPKRQIEVQDQVNHEFVPFVNPILVGSSVTFPNKDNVRHHVYSFSPAKRFELPLYVGTPAQPVLFDKPGVVVLGCNIHDWMIAYIYVSESPYYAKTGIDGIARLVNLPARAYTVRVWHPRLEGAEEATRKLVDLGAAPSAELSYELRLKTEVRVRRAPVPGAGGRY
jgi:plastocyanin